MLGVSRVGGWNREGRDAWPRGSEGCAEVAWCSGGPGKVRKSIARGLFDIYYLSIYIYIYVDARSQEGRRFCSRWS